MNDSLPGPGDSRKQAGTAGSSRPRVSLLPLVLLLLALLDLRTDLLLLLDHFTLTTLLTGISSHPLAVVVLVAQPSLWRRYTGGQR